MYYSHSSSQAAAGVRRVGLERLAQTCTALRQEGHVLHSRSHTVGWVTDMALLTEGGLCATKI